MAAFKKVREDYPQLILQLSTMGTRSREVLEAQMRVLKSVGINPEEVEIGLELTTPADVLYLSDYIQQGIKFFSYDNQELAAALLSSNLNHPDVFVIEGKNNMIAWVLEMTTPYIKGIIAENKARGIWLGARAGQLPLEKERKGSPYYAFTHMPKDRFTLREYQQKTGVALSTARSDFNILEELGLVSIHRASGGKPNEIECIVSAGLKAPITQILQTYRSKKDLARIKKEIAQILTK